jgi:hypothetical protein
MSLCTTSIPILSTSNDDFSDGLLGPAGLSTPDATHQAYGRIYAALVGQAQTLAYIDTFWVMAIGTLCLIPLVFCLVRPERGKAVAAH